MSTTTLVRDKVQTALNRQIANWSILYVKLHNYHWFVSGENFYELHAKFEHFYTKAAHYVDELAERLLAIKGKPVASMREYLEAATIKEASGHEASIQMVEVIANDFAIIIEELKRDTEAAEEVGDNPTADMLIHIRTELEKELWMLNSFLNRGRSDRS